MVLVVVTSNRGPDKRMWRIGQKILESRARGPGGDCGVKTVVYLSAFYGLLVLA